MGRKKKSGQKRDEIKTLTTKKGVNECICVVCWGAELPVGGSLSLPSSLFNHFFLWNWPWILLTFIQTGQSDRQPITDESKTQGISERQQDQHSRHIRKGGKGKTVKGVKNIFF